MIYAFWWGWWLSLSWMKYAEIQVSQNRMSRLLGPPISISVNSLRSTDPPEIKFCKQGGHGIAGQIGWFCCYKRSFQWQQELTASYDSERIFTHYRWFINQSTRNECKARIEFIISYVVTVGRICRVGQKTRSAQVLVCLPQREVRTRRNYQLLTQTPLAKNPEHSSAALAEVFPREVWDSEASYRCTLTPSRDIAP